MYMQDYRVSCVVQQLRNLTAFYSKMKNTLYLSKMNEHHDFQQDAARGWKGYLKEVGGF